MLYVIVTRCAEIESSAHELIVMYSRPLSTLSWFIASFALVLTACSDETGGSEQPLGPAPAGTPSIGLAGSSGTVAGVGAAGRGPAGAAGAAAIGGAGRAAAGSGTAGNAAPSGLAGIGAAGAAAVAGSGSPNAGASGGAAGMGAAGGTAGRGTAGAMAQAGTGAMPMGMGACCADGNCLCHGPEPTRLTTSDGPFDTDSFRISSGTVYYPTDAEPPFAAVGVCGGFLNTGPEMETWGPMYASHGIVTVIVTTTGADFPDIRAAKLLAAIEELQKINGDMSSPLGGKLAGRYGTSGYSMGGGGTTIASSENSMLKTSVGLAAFGGTGNGLTVATLLLCGDSDGTAPCSMSSGVYRAIPDSTPKMMITFRGATHFSWFGPGDAGRGESGAYALAFQKVFLEGDERWKPLLLMPPQNGTAETNID